MTLEEKKQKLEAATERFRETIHRLTQQHEAEIQKILKEIDGAQMEILKKQLGI